MVYNSQGMFDASDQDMRCRYDDSVNKILNKVFDSVKCNQSHDQRYQCQHESDAASTQSPSFPTFEITKLSKWQEEYTAKKFLECNSTLRALRIQRVFESLQDNRIAQIRQAQALSIACQFDKYVALLKHFDKWLERTKRRKEALQSYRQLMRKIMLVWRSHAGEQIQQRVSVYLINQCMKSFQSRVLRYAIAVWGEKCCKIKFALRVIIAWRLINSRSTLEQKWAIERLQLNLKQEVLKQWRDAVVVQMHMRQRQHCQLKQLFTMWRSSSEESILKWKLAIRSAESLSDEISFKRVGRGFDFMVSNGFR